MAHRVGGVREAPDALRRVAEPARWRSADWLRECRRVDRAAARHGHAARRRVARGIRGAAMTVHLVENGARRYIDYFVARCDALVSLDDERRDRHKPVTPDRC